MYTYLFGAWYTASMEDAAAVMIMDQVEFSGMYANIVVANFKEKIRYFFRKIADFPGLIVNNWAKVAYNHLCCQLFDARN